MKTVVQFQLGEPEGGIFSAVEYLSIGFTSLGYKVITVRGVWSHLLDILKQHSSDILLLHDVPPVSLFANFGNLLRNSVIVVHTFLCNGSKLFRRLDTVCNKSIGLGCIEKWYTGPCGSSKSPINDLKGYYQAADRSRSLRAFPGKIVVGSLWMKNYLRAEGIFDGRVVVMPFFYPSDLADRNSEGNNTFINMLFVGRIVYNKGLQYLIRALPLVPQARLVVLGDGWYFDDIRKLVAEARVSDQVLFEGWKNHGAIGEYYANAQIVVVPSIIPEPLGLVVGEARSRGTWVITSNRGGLPEWGKRDTGVVAMDPRDVGQLAQEIKHLAHIQPPKPPLYRHDFLNAWSTFFNNTLGK